MLETFYCECKISSFGTGCLENLIDKDSGKSPWLINDVWFSHGA